MSARREVVSGKVGRMSARRLALLATTMLAVGACPVAASGEEADDDTVETVVVTARKRAESVQEVPISITALSGEQLTALGAGDFRELDGYVPNMVQVGLDTNITPTISIRGISSDGRNTGFESGVSVYVDGVYTGRPISWMGELVDVQSFEVLRGPQGTLFGKNTIAGAINITTRKPGPEFAGSAEAEYGNYDLFRARGTISGPIVADKVFAGISAFRTRRDGFQTNLANGKDYWNKNDYGGRVQLRFLPSENLEILVAADALHERLRLNVNTLVTPVGGPFGVPVGSGPRDININEDVYSHRDIRGGNVNITYNTPGGGTITSITAHRWNDIEFLTDEDLTSAAVFPRLYTHFIDEEKQFTQELRYASPSERRFRYLAGLYYYDQTVSTDRESISPPGGFGGLNPTMAVGPKLVGKTKTRDFAAFAQADYDITDQLELTVGLRYTDTNKDLDVVLNGLPAFGIISIPQSKYKQSDEALSPMASLLYKINDDINLYASVSRGFKGGGFNADFVSNAALAFDAEYATNWEAGLKAFAWSRKLRFNLALFHTDYSDLQVSSLSPLGGFIIENAGSANIDGMEADLELHPWTGFTLNAGLGFTEAKFSDYEPNPAFNGNRLLNSPKWTASLTAQQRFPLGDLGSVTVRGEYNYRSHYFVGLANARPFEHIPGYDLLNARVTFTTADGRYDVQAWGENLGDDLFVVDRGRPIGGAFGQRSVVYGKPRTYGMRVLARF